MNDERASGPRPAWIALALVLAVAATYAEVGSLGFVRYDDPDYVFENPAVRGGLTWEGLRWAFTETHASNWHPLTWLAHMLDVELFGLRAGAHHWMSVGECVDRLVANRTTNEFRTHRFALLASDDVRQQITQLEFDVRL